MSAMSPRATIQGITFLPSTQPSAWRASVRISGALGVVLGVAGDPKASFCVAAIAQLETFAPTRVTAPQHGNLYPTFQSLHSARLDFVSASSE